MDNPFLDYQGPTKPGYAVFGKVVQGLNVVDDIALMPVGQVNAFSNVPLVDVTITSASQVQ